MDRPLETFAGGPISRGLWDTRTKENCWWCATCQLWLRRNRWVTPEVHDRLCHQNEAGAP